MSYYRIPLYQPSDPAINSAEYLLSYLFIIKELNLEVVYRTSMAASISDDVDNPVILRFLSLICRMS